MTEEKKSFLELAGQPAAKNRSTYTPDGKSPLAILLYKMVFFSIEVEADPVRVQKRTVSQFKGLE